MELNSFRAVNFNENKESRKAEKYSFSSFTNCRFLGLGKLNVRANESFTVTVFQI